MNRKLVRADQVNRRYLASLAVLRIASLAVMLAWIGGWSKKPVEQSAPPPAAPSSAVRVSTGADSISIETATAEFTIAPDGYVAAKLLSNQQKLSLDDAGGNPGILVVAGGKEMKDFVFDLKNAKTSSPEGKLGGQGKRIVVDGKSASTGLEASLTVEVHDEFPNVALISSSICNTGGHDISLDQVGLDRHRLNAALADAKCAPNQMWSFHGASIRWGKDNVFEMPKTFQQQNQMGSMVEVKGDLGRVGGGIPLFPFLSRQGGEENGAV